MTKKQLKEKLKPYYKNQEKLMFCKQLRDYTNTNLRRLVYEVVNPMWQVSRFEKDFNTLWNLLTKEEKDYLRYKIKSYD